MNKENKQFEKGITKKLIDETIMDAYKENAIDLNLRYVSMLKEYFDDSPKPEDLLSGYILASICTAYTAAMDSVKMVLYELLGIEDTSSAGKEDIQAEQNGKQAPQPE